MSLFCWSIRRLPGLSLLLLVSVVCSVAGAESADKRLTLGWVERVKLQKYDILLHAKLDTGADSSSLNATDMEEFERGKKAWVRFTVRNRYGDKVSIERPIVRIARIKGHFQSQKRLVIRLGVCVANVYMEEEVNLVNRSNFDYQMLIGRSFLAGKAFIDPASNYLVDPECG